MRIIFAIHGIRSPKKDNWVFKFADFVGKDPRFKDDLAVPHSYGYLLAINSVNPKTKFDHVKRVMRELRGLTSPQCYEKLFKDLKIYNHQQKDLGHSDYFKGTKLFKEWLDIIAA